MNPLKECRLPESAADNEFFVPVYVTNKGLKFGRLCKSVEDAEKSESGFIFITKLVEVKPNETV